MQSIETIAFKKGALHLIDQRKLPGHYEIFVCSDYRDVEFAIRDMVVRGAPAIGATAAYGVYLAARDLSTLEGEAFLRELKKACDVLEATRPTAVNLRWAIRRMYTLADKESAKGSRSVTERLKKRLISSTQKISKRITEWQNTESNWSPKGQGFLPTVIPVPWQRRVGEPPWGLFGRPIPGTKASSSTQMKHAPTPRRTAYRMGTCPGGYSGKAHSRQRRCISHATGKDRHCHGWCR